MEKRMTSGEIAKKAGVSQKAIRLYDEKGLLKPSDYSEGNYRLYDEEALLVLEKIIALKQVGFSLEEIRDNLIVEKNMNIRESLNHQLEIMEKRKREIQQTIDCIKGMLARTDGEPDWDSVAEIACMIQKDQDADEKHYNALKHTADKVDWYVRIFESLNIAQKCTEVNVEINNASEDVVSDVEKESDNVVNKVNILDIGCGFGKLWRNNWKEIPNNINILGIDVHESWAEDFEKYIVDNKKLLADGSDITIQWGDIEKDETWSLLNSNKYNYIIAHYLFDFIKDKELFIQRVVGALNVNGVFSCNGYSVNERHFYWKTIFENMKLSTKFIENKILKEQEECNQFREMLSKYFSKIETVNLSNSMKYNNCGEIFEELCDNYSKSKKYFIDNERVIKAYFNKIISDNGEMVIKGCGEFLRCYK